MDEEIEFEFQGVEDVFPGVLGKWVFLVNVDQEAENDLKYVDQPECHQGISEDVADYDWMAIESDVIGIICGAVFGKKGFSASKGVKNVKKNVDEKCYSPIK